MLILLKIEKMGRLGEDLTISWLFEANDIHQRMKHSLDVTIILNREFLDSAPTVSTVYKN
jgi:hypothetical protein